MRVNALIFLLVHSAVGGRCKEREAYKELALWYFTAATGMMWSVVVGVFRSDRTEAREATQNRTILKNLISAWLYFPTSTTTTAALAALCGGISHRMDMDRLM